MLQPLSGQSDVAVRLRTFGLLLRNMLLWTAAKEHLPSEMSLAEMKISWSEKICGKQCRQSGITFWSVSVCLKLWDILFGVFFSFYLYWQREVFYCSSTVWLTTFYETRQAWWFIVFVNTAFTSVFYNKLCNQNHEYANKYKCLPYVSATVYIYLPPLKTFYSPFSYVYSLL